MICRFFRTSHKWAEVFKMCLEWMISKGNYFSKIWYYFKEFLNEDNVRTNELMITNIFVQIWYKISLKKILTKTPESILIFVIFHLQKSFAGQMVKNEKKNCFWFKIKKKLNIYWNLLYFNLLLMLRWLSQFNYNLESKFD